GGERAAALRFLDLETRLLRHPGHVAADSAEVADRAVLFQGRVREGSRRHQVEENVDDAPRLVGIEPRLDPLPLTFLSWKEIAGAGHTGGLARSREELLGCRRVERELNLTAATDAVLFRDAPGAAGLVVPHMKRAVGGLIDPVDAPPEAKPLRRSERDLDRLGRSEIRVEGRPGHAEGHFEVSRRDGPAVILLFSQERPAGDRDRLAAESEGRRASRRNTLSPDVDRALCDLIQLARMARDRRRLSARRDLREEAMENIVQ